MVACALVGRRRGHLRSDGDILHRVDPLELKAFWGLLRSRVVLIALVDGLRVRLDDHRLGRWHLLLCLGVSDVGRGRSHGRIAVLALGLLLGDSLVLLPLILEEVLLAQLRLNLLLITERSVDLAAEDLLLELVRIDALALVV